VSLELEHELVERLGGEVETARGASDDQVDVGDLAHVDELKEEYFTRADTDSAILAQVRAALERIDNGTYGKCVVDGGTIDAKRLESVPWMPYCLKLCHRLLGRPASESGVLCHGDGAQGGDRLRRPWTSGKPGPIPRFPLYSHRFPVNSHALTSVEGLWDEMRLERRFRRRLPRR
jgi:DnaK suppressor protein